MTTPSSQGETLRVQWERLRSWPCGRWLFSRMLGVNIPYTGSIRPYVLELAPGYAKVQMRERRAVRNHLHSVHAIALMNLGEVATGLAMTLAMPANARGIVTGLSMEYLKKARGLLTAECRTTPFDATVSAEHEFHADIRDENGDVVARATARWLVGPVPTK